MLRPGVTKSEPFFQYENRFILAMFDVPHLFKSVRNVLSKHNIKITDGISSYKTIVGLYFIDKNKTTKLCPRLNKRHIFSIAFEKMSARLAMQVLSNSVAKGIRTANKFELFKNTKYNESRQLPFL